MHVIGRIGIGVAICAEAAGAFFLAMTIYSFVLYFADTKDPLRHEYLMGVGIGLLYSVGSLLVASVIAITLKKSLSNGAFRWLVWPGLVVGGTFFILYLISVGFGMAYG